MDIDFIKWMCGKAEGIECIKITKQKVLIIDYGMSTMISVGSYTWKNHVKSLLLYRALRQILKEEAIHYGFHALRDILLDDEKLEIRLKYIYEQEK